MKHLNYEDYLRIVNKLKPIYIESLNVSKKLSVDSTNFNFLGSWKCAVMELTNVKLNASETQIFESVLALTAALEFALGNIYFTLTHGKQPPHLLKDLLNAAELQGFLGKGAVSFNFKNLFRRFNVSSFQFEFVFRFGTLKFFWVHQTLLTCAT